VLALGVAGESIINNALLESFAVHARVLLDFLYTDSPRYDDDVVASDFFTKPEEWGDIRPEKSEKLDNIHHRVGKEVAHLTYTRQLLTEEMKQWNPAELGDEILEICNLFMKSMPQHLHGQKWKNNLPQ
jgi:hypothetical protein